MNGTQPVPYRLMVLGGTKPVMKLNNFNGHYLMVNTLHMLMELTGAPGKGITICYCMQR